MLNQDTYEIISKYESVAEAAEDTLISSDDIMTSLATGVSAGGCLWNRQYLQMNTTPKRSFSNKKTVAQIDANGVTVATFESVNQATKKTGITNIDKAARGIIQFAGGYTWEYRI